MQACVSTHGAHLPWSAPRLQPYHHPLPAVTPINKTASGMRGAEQTARRLCADHRGCGVPACMFAHIAPWILPHYKISQTALSVPGETGRSSPTYRRPAVCSVFNQVHAEAGVKKMFAEWRGSHLLSAGQDSQPASLIAICHLIAEANVTSRPQILHDKSIGDWYVWTLCTKIVHNGPLKGDKSARSWIMSPGRLQTFLYSSHYLFFFF